MAYPRQDLPGVITYGPYAHLQAGSYDLKLKYTASTDRSGTWDLIFAGKQIFLKKGTLPRQESGWFRENVFITEEETNKGLEFRVWYKGEGSLRVEEMASPGKVPLRSCPGLGVFRGNISLPVVSHRGGIGSPSVLERMELSAGHGIFVLSAIFALFRFWETRYWLEFPDETDNIVVGWLISQGYTLYQDLFAHHMPMTYMLAHTIVTLFPHQDFQQYRMVQPILLLASALAISKSPVFSKPRGGWIAATLSPNLYFMLVPRLVGKPIPDRGTLGQRFSRLELPFVSARPNGGGGFKDEKMADLLGRPGTSLLGMRQFDNCLPPPHLPDLDLAAFSIFSSASRKALGRILRTPLFYAGLVIIPLVHVVWLSLYASWRGFLDLAISFNNVYYAKYVGLTPEMNGFRKASLLMVDGWMFLMGSNPSPGGSQWFDKGELIFEVFSDLRSRCARLPPSILLPEEAGSHLFHSSWSVFLCFFAGEDVTASLFTYSPWHGPLPAAPFGS